MCAAAQRPVRRPARADRPHCYRILGSVQEGEGLLQQTLPAAWRGIGGYEERASLRTWLHRLAADRCLNTLGADVVVRCGAEDTAGPATDGRRHR
ncbi:sigma factor [Streptomyces sp. NPDC086835]|uniref:sigma factor n=1 Tax=Streptomyces sp. NPDC086835 TaxID=3365761 RepID=UPI00381275F1